MAAAILVPAVGILPMITLEGDANGEFRPAPSTCAGKFIDAYRHRTVGGCINHDLAQETREAVAKAVIDVAHISAAV